MIRNRTPINNSGAASDGFSTGKYSAKRVGTALIRTVIPSRSKRLALLTK